jgi:hypothetical protein
MAHSKEAHGQMAQKHSKGGMVSHFGESHWEKKGEETQVADLKYAGEMSNPSDLKRSVDALAGYVKKNAMKY